MQLWKKTSGSNNNVKASIAKIIGTALDLKTVKYGASLLGIPPKKMNFATLRVELYGHGRSDGNIKDYTLYKGVGNALTVVEYAKSLTFVTDVLSWTGSDCTRFRG